MNNASTVRLALTLGVAGALSGLVIVVVQAWATPLIEQNRARTLQSAVLEVLPGSKSSKPMVWSGGKLTEASDPPPPDAVFAGYNADGKLVGYGIRGEGAGFQDTIRLIIGYDASGRKIIGYRVLESKETPGLGDRIFKDKRFNEAFSSLHVDPTVVLTKPGEAKKKNEIDAISGATISSKAVLKIVNASLVTWRDRLGPPPAAPGGAP